MFEKKQLRAELVIAGISQAELARRLGINKSTLYKKINGITEWTLSEIRKVGEVLGVDKIPRIFFAGEFPKRSKMQN